MSAEEIAERGRRARDALGGSDQWGAAEKVLDEALDGDWIQSSIAQFGPDGTTLIGQIVFLVCPLCGSLVPPLWQGLDFQSWHRQMHKIEFLRAEQTKGALEEMYDDF